MHTITVELTPTDGRTVAELDGLFHLVIEPKIRSKSYVDDLLHWVGDNHLRVAITGPKEEKPALERVFGINGLNTLAHRFGEAGASVISAHLGEHHLPIRCGGESALVCQASIPLYTFVPLERAS